MGIAAGEFVNSYGTEKEKGQWDCVMTCFFLDTAVNVLDYLDVIKNILKPGGIWINFGPLEWHWANAPPLQTQEQQGDGRWETSLELPFDILSKVITGGAYNFTYLHPPEVIPVTYCQQPNRLKHKTYRCIHFVAQREDVRV